MLDLSRIADQVNSMVSQLKAGVGQRHQNMLRALNLMHDKSVDFEKLKRKIAISAGKTTFLVAVPAEVPDSHFEEPTAPHDHSILATDGSHIDIDRHQTARCYLINIGRVRLDYGNRSDAIMDNVPQLYANDKDMVISNGIKEQAIEGQLLGIRRGIEELRHLSEMAKQVSQPTLALIDGSLILWGLTGKEYADFVLDELLDKGFLNYLDVLRRIASEKQLAVAAYVSFPRSTDVVNILRIALCPHEVSDCDKYCEGTTTGKRPCDSIAGVQDRDLLDSILGDGERSALFMTQSRIVEKRYGAQRIYFFYLKNEFEIARVEIPEWVAAEKPKLDLSHALILDQCRRGGGYPVALSEAHEQAVVSGADRENFQRMIEMWLTEENMPSTISAKSRSKRTRWL